MAEYMQITMRAMMNPMQKLRNGELKSNAGSLV